jgi:hypothetical protein
MPRSLGINPHRSPSSGLSAPYRCRCARCLALLSAVLGTAAVEALDPVGPAERLCLASEACAIHQEMLPPWTPDGWDGSEMLQPTSAEIGVVSGGRQVYATATFDGSGSLLARHDVVKGAALSGPFEPPWIVPPA